MKIKVADLEPNPFRNMEKYPIDRNRIESLKNSIKEKTFWDNILVRKHPTKPGKFQLSYGHHRWIALKEIGITEIDVPVKELSDSIMLKIMAEENLDWSTSPAVMTQTILTTKEFLDTELAKYETWKDFRSGDFANTLFLFENAGNFSRAKKEGVGRKTLCKFLGGNWTSYKVRTALNIINDSIIDIEAVCEIPTLEQAEVFRRSVNNYKTPKKKQRKLVKKILKEGIGKRDIPKLVRDNSETPQDKDKTDIQLEQIKKVIENIDSQSRSLFNNILDLRRYMKQMEIEEIKGVKVWLAGSSAKKLLNELLRLKESCDETNS